MDGKELDKIDWDKVDGVGASKPKKDWGEVFMGLWYFYMFLCLTFFLGAVADIIDGTSDYLGGIRFLLLFLIPCVIYLVVKAFKLFEGDR